MRDDKKTGRAGKPDKVEEAVAESFPASDPPAWTVARSGLPRSPDGRECGGADRMAAVHGEAIGLFATEADAQAAADALLAAGFNFVEIGPPRSRGNLGAGLGAPDKSGAALSLGLCAALGALAAGAIAALFVPRGARHLAVVAAAGGAIGAISSQSALRIGERQAALLDWPRDGVLLRVKIRSFEDQKRALALIEGQGAHRLNVSWRRGGR